MALCYGLLHSFWTLILSSDKITATASLVVCIFDEWTLVVFVWVIDKNVEFVRTSQKPGMEPFILPRPTLSLDVLTVKQKELQIHKRAKYESKGQLTTDALTIDLKPGMACCFMGAPCVLTSYDHQWRKDLLLTGSRGCMCYFQPETNWAHLRNGLTKTS